MKCLENHALIIALKRYETYGFQSRTDGRTDDQSYTFFYF